MAGMRNLGRGYNVVAAASGLGMNLKDCSGVGLVAVCTTAGAVTLTFTAATSFGGTYVNVTPANGFGQPNTVYTQSTSGTAAWVAAAANWGGPPATNVLNLGTLTLGNTAYLDYLVSELADTYDYLKVVAAGASLAALKYDLTVQRTPQNLAIVSA